MIESSSAKGLDHAYVNESGILPTAIEFVIEFLLNSKWSILPVYNIKGRIVVPEMGNQSDLELGHLQWMYDEWFLDKFL